MRSPLQPPPRILVAEDDREMRSLVAGALRRDGYDVKEVADGGALAQLTFHAKQPDLDLLISDIRMPTSSGLAVLLAMRRARWTIPVILMTAFGDDETRALVEQLGAVFFDKPFDIDDLRTAVMNLVPIP